MIEWKEIVAYNGMYSVSNTGLIRNNKTNKILKQTVIKTGYLTVTVKPNGRSSKCKCFRVHREIAKAFIENPENKRTVNHKNGNKLDNNISNLEWNTYRENIIHAYDNNLIKFKTGYDSPLSVLTPEFVDMIRKEYIPRDRKFGLRALGRKYGVPHNTLSNALAHDMPL